MNKNHSLLQSIRYALTGLKDAIENEPNLKIHITLAFFVCVLAYILGFTHLEWAVLILTIGIVFILELMNTTLETLVDIISPHLQEKARVAKDVSAAGVLIAALLSIIVGVFLFLPKIF